MPAGIVVAGLAVALFVAAALGVAFLLRRSKRRPRPTARRLPAPRYPLVLLHGVMGFDEIAVGRQRHAYFRGVTERLEALGALVHRPRGPPSASVNDGAGR